MINKSDNSQKLSNFKSNSSYSNVKKDLILKTERKLSKIVIENKDHFIATKYRQLIQYYNKILIMYGHPKIHKDSTPLRSIMESE